MKILKDLVRWYDIILFPAAIFIIGYSVYHTWYQNTPERWADPVNWVLNACLLLFTILFFGLGENNVKFDS